MSSFVESCWAFRIDHWYLSSLDCVIPTCTSLILWTWISRQIKTQRTLLRAACGRLGYFGWVTKKKEVFTKHIIWCLGTVYSSYSPWVVGQYVQLDVRGALDQSSSAGLMRPYENSLDKTMKCLWVKPKGCQMKENRDYLRSQAGHPMLGLEKVCTEKYFRVNVFEYRNSLMWNLFIHHNSTQLFHCERQQQRLASISGSCKSPHSMSISGPPSFAL